MDVQAHADVPPRSRLLPTYFAWTFGVSWGLVLVARLALVPVHDAPDGALLGVTWLDDLLWVLLILAFLACPGLVAWRIALRWRVPVHTWGWLRPDPRVLWGVVFPIAVFAVAYVVALIWPPEDWEPTYLTLTSLPDQLVVSAIGSGLLMLGVELGFRGVVQTELSRLGLARACVLAAVATLAWLGSAALLATKRPDFPMVALGVLEFLAWCIVAGWVRVRSGSVVASALVFGAWAAMQEVAGSPLDAEAMTLAPQIAATAAIVLLAVWALLRPPTQDRWPRRPRERHRAEHVLAEPINRHA